jgi:hypothetical protein
MKNKKWNQEQKAFWRFGGIFTEKIQQINTLQQFIFNKKIYRLLPKKAPKATFKEVLNYIEHLRKNYNLHPKTSTTLFIRSKNILQLSTRNRTKKRSSLQ